MIIITGAAGFIGSQLAERLNIEGFNDLVLVDDFSKESQTTNYSHLKHTTRVDRKSFPQWLRENENQVQFVFHLGCFVIILSRHHRHHLPEPFWL